MNAARLAMCAAALALLGSTAGAGAAAPAAGPRGFVEKTLANGLRIVVIPNPLAPVVTTWLNVLAGSDDERFTGTAHAQEHMFYRGSKTLSGAQADEIAGFTGDVDDADTQNEITQFYHVVPAQDLDVALQLDANRFAGLLDAQHDWDQERGAILQEVAADNSDATYRLEAKLQLHVMAGTAYADPGLGTFESFKRQIEAPQLQAFYHAWYHPNNAVYVIAGDITPDVAFASVARYFGRMPRAALPAHVVGRLRPLAAAHFSDTSNQGSTVAMIAYRYPGYTSPDYAASVILSDVLNSERGDLFGLVAAGRALAVEFDANPFPQSGFALVQARVPTSTTPAAALADLSAVIASYRAHGVPAALVSAAEQREVAAVQLAAASLQSQAQLWSNAVAVEHRTPFDDLDAIERVKPKDVDRVLRRYLVAATASTAYAVPKQGVADTGEAAGRAPENTKAGASTHIEPLPGWALAALRTLHVPEAAGTPSAFTLPNGLHIVVQPEHASSAVVVTGTILHNPGLQDPAGQAGVGDVLEALLPFGTTRYSRVAYQAQLDAISADVQTGYDFELTVLRPHFDRGVELLAEDELHPALAPDDFAVVRQQQTDQLAGDATTPDHLAAVALAERLYPPGDPSRRFASAADVAKLSLNDVRASYAATFRPDLTTIAIVGDVTPAEAKAAVARWFGGWKHSGPAPVLFPAPAPYNAAAESFVPDTSRKQDSVNLRETLPLGITDPDVAPLEVADTMLSGDFSSILIRDMRVTTGYVYAVGTRLSTGKLRSTFGVQYACDPANLDRAQAVLIRDFQRLQHTPVAAERLQRAKSRLISTVALEGQSYEGVAKGLAGDVSLGLPLDYGLRRARDELAVTAGDVQTAMSRWIRPQGFVRVVTGPPDTK